jgi:hypothetical protein
VCVHEWLRAVGLGRVHITWAMERGENSRPCLYHSPCLERQEGRGAWEGIGAWEERGSRSRHR